MRFLKYLCLLVGAFLLSHSGDAWSEPTEPGDTLQDCDVCPVVVVVPPGTYMMGTPLGSREIDLTRGEGPQVEISIDYSFAVGRTEVTHGQFSAFVDATGHEVLDGCRVWDDKVGFNDSPDASWLDRRQPEKLKDDHPVGCVSWLDAKAYVAWLSEVTGARYRLLTEAEWEYAARAGTTTPRFWGARSAGACAYANTYDIAASARYPFPWFNVPCNDGYADLAPVGQFKPNAFGLYDMIGNVWEWTEDCFAATHVGRPTDGSAWIWEKGCDLHANRGGGWLSAPERNRVAWPGRDPADKRNTQFGFRVARDLTTENRSIAAGETGTPGPAYDLDRSQLESVLADLRAWLPGAWDSYPQVWYERNVTMPAEGEHEHWHRPFALIDAPQVGETVFYGQINLGGRAGPILPRSQVLYKAVIDEERGVVSITGQGPADPERFADLHKRPELWGEVRMRDEAAVRCDFIWRRDGAQIAGVLEGKTEQRRKYGPGTCTYISDSGAEFYADAEWVLTPEELWLYDINTIRGVQFIGRKDRTHIRLYRARPYQCTVTNGETMPVVANAHDRGFSGSVLLADGSSAEWQLLRAWYPSADARGIADQTRLTLNHASSAKNLAAKTAPAKTSRISIDSGGLTVDCQLQAEFDM